MLTTNDPRRHVLLHRIQERTDALLERTASTIQEALERYVRSYEVAERPPDSERRKRPRSP